MKLKKTKLREKADQVFSRFIRSKYAHEGYVNCVTCGTNLEVKKAQAGHYIKRSVSSLRYSEDNVYPQCYRCNILLKGNYPNFALYLIEKFGKKHLEKLEKKSRELIKTNEKFYQEVIDKYSSPES